jgi:hypothetical protein
VQRVDPSAAVSQPPPTEPPGAQGAVEVRQGQCFQFAVPEGWRVVEEGQFAIVMLAPDDTAFTLMVGACGLFPGANPIGFAHEKLASIPGVSQLQLGQPRQGRPQAGFPGAQEVDCTYQANGIQCQGVATVSVRPGYNAVDFILVCAAAHAAHWPRYATWLPQVAAHAVPTSPAAFGAQAVAQQNLASSTAFGQQLAASREHSQRLAEEVAAHREQSDLAQAQGRGESLTGESWYGDPHGNPPQRLSNSTGFYWSHPDGRVHPTDDPTYDPRVVEQDPRWQRMERLPPG